LPRATDRGQPPAYRQALGDLVPWLIVASALTVLDAFGASRPLAVPEHSISLVWTVLFVAAGVRVQRRGGPVGHTWAASWRLTLLASSVAIGADVAQYAVLGIVPPATPQVPAMPGSIGIGGWALIGVGASISLVLLFTITALVFELPALVGYGLSRVLAGPPAAASA
jgi:hypothetical protein